MPAAGFACWCAPGACYGGVAVCRPSHHGEAPKTTPRVKAGGGVARQGLVLRWMACCAGLWWRQFTGNAAQRLGGSGVCGCVRCIELQAAPVASVPGLRHVHRAPWRRLTARCGGVHPRRVVRLATGQAPMPMASSSLRHSPHLTHFSLNALAGVAPVGRWPAQRWQGQGESGQQLNGCSVSPITTTPTTAAR